MEKFREIEINLQNKINEIIGIDTLFDDYVKDRNEYDKELFNSLINNNTKLSNKINKAIEYIHNNQPVFELSSKEQLQEWFEKEYYVELLKILKGEE